jgi:hypothetical protein
MDPNRNIINRLGLQGLSDEKKEAMLDQASELIEKRLMIRLMENLEDIEIKEAESLSNDPEKMLAYMSSKVKNFSSLVQQEVDKLRNEMLLDSSSEIES